MKEAATLTDILHAVLMIGKDVLSLTETALLTGYSPRHLRTLAGRGEIPHGKHNGRLFFSKAEVQKWLLGDTAQTAAPAEKKNKQQTK